MSQSTQCLGCVSQLFIVINSCGACIRVVTLLHVKCLQIEWNHSTPSISGGKKSTSGRRLVIMAAFPRIRWREIFCISWLTTSLSSDPVCHARAAPRRLSWLTARWCIPPSVSRAMGRKTSPCCLQASAVRLGICQKNYRTEFSGERILHTENA